MQKIPWRRVAAEGLVIVLSILLAFAIDAWWDRYQAGQEERLVLEGLHADFEASVDTLYSFWVASHEDALTSSIELMRVGGGRERLPGDLSLPSEAVQELVAAVARDWPREGERSVTIPSELLGLTLAAPSFDPALGTFESLLQSGSLTTISNPELRRALAVMPAMLEDAQDIEFVLRDIVLGRYRDALHSAGLIVAAEAMFTDGPPVALTFSRDLANALAQRMTYTYLALRELNAVGDAMREILRLVESELEA